MRIIAKFTVLAALAPVVHSQSLLYTFDGDSEGDHLGTVSGAGDVNADGVPDFIVGARYDDNNGPNSGSATVYSGSDGSLLWTWDGAAAGDEFSNWFQGVSGAGDANADGYADLIVGAENHGGGSGSATVFSGLDGSVLWQLYGGHTGDRFGNSVSGAGDVNMDGHDDVIVGARLENASGLLDPGTATVFSGVDGSVLWKWEGISASENFGWSVSGAGDVNLDGHADVIVGTQPSNAEPGRALVLSGADGMVIHSLTETWDGFGVSVSGAGDVNMDGYPDLIVGAWGADSNGQNSGKARVYSGVDGGVLYTFRGDRKGVTDSIFQGDQLGLSVSGAGDVNGDGYADLIAGIPLHDNNGTNSGGARVYSGVDGSVLYTFEGSVGAAGGQTGAGDQLGFSVSCVGDVNADGLDDLIVGAITDDSGGTDSGSAQVFLSRSEMGTSYCSPAVINSSGQPGVIRSLGLAGAAENETFLTAYQLPRSTAAQPKFGMFIVSQTQDHFMLPGSDGFLCLGGNIGRISSNIRPGPTFSMQIDLTSIPVNPTQSVMAGETWNFQAWFRDNNPDGTTNFTDGVSITFQ